MSLSLTDAFLLEAHRDPRAVWIALRNGTGRGCGTLDDPYDASVRSTPTISISTLTYTGYNSVTGNFENTAVTAMNHGFVTGDMVTISGVQTSTPGKPADDRYMGTFPVTRINDTTFTYPIGASYYILGMGEPASPQAFGNITCWLERELFDTWMRTMPPNALVHIGPGVFETKGMNTGVISWMPRSGQKLLGSGMALTTLKLVGVETPENYHWAIGIHYYWYVQDFEVSDLTVDCNVSGQRSPFVTCGAVGVTGKHIRIRRVRAINFGAHTKGYFENFVLASGAISTYLEDQGYQSGDCVIEDCVLERPSPNPRWNSTMTILAGGEEAAGGVMTYHRGCVVRNCFINGQLIYGTLVPLPVQSIAANDPVANVVTVTTQAPHQLTKPGNAVLRSVTVGGSLDNLFNGVFEIDSIESPTVFRFRLATSSTPDSGTGFVGGGVSTHPVSVEKIVPDDTLLVCDSLALHSFDEYEERFVMTTRVPHQRTMFNNVRLGGVELAPSVGSAAFNGSFTVTDYNPVKPLELSFALNDKPDIADSNNLLLTYAVANQGHIALPGDGGTAAVVEGNRVFHCSTGQFHDTWATADLVVRNNYFHDVMMGVFQILSGISTTFVPNPLVSLVRDGSTAKATTAFPHGLRALDSVTISADDAHAVAYGGLRVIDAVTAPNRFEYAMDDTSVGPAASAGYATSEKVGNTPLGPQKRLDSLFYVFRSGKHVAIAKTTYAKHGLLAGDVVRVTRAGQFINGSFELASEFNGNFKITSVPNPDTFEYEISGDPSFDSESEDFSAGYFGRIWQTRNLAIENNVIELAVRTLDPNAFSGSTGIPMYGTAIYSPQYSLGRVHIRGNVIRNLDDKSAPKNRAIELGGCENVVLEGNVIGVDRVSAIEHQTYQILFTFNNTSPDGKLIESVHQSSQQPVQDLVKKIHADLEGAMSLSLFPPEDEW